MDKSDIYLRRAMWESYKKKCVYCGIALEVRHMEVDHILPVDEKKITTIKDPDLKLYIDELNKNSFEKNCIENYILTCSDCNKKKKNYSFSASSFRFYHEYASRHVPDILKRIERTKRGINDFTNIKQPPLDCKKYDESELTCEAQITNSIFQSSFRYGLGNVRIDAFLPVTYEDKMSCLISFKELYQSDIFITYNEDDIKNYLFTGYKTQLNSGNRRWCTFYEDLIASPIYEINLPNIKLHVSVETLEQMAKISDRLFEEYTLQISTINNILGASDFQKVDEKSYKLFSIRKDIFQILLNFMKDHQYEQANDNKYNIFHLTNSSTFFYLHRNRHSNKRADIYACINLVDAYNYYDVIWSPGYTACETDKMKDFDNAIKWTALYTYEWFINDCIPYALNEYYYNSLNIFQRLYNRKLNNKIYSAESLLINNFLISYKSE